MSETTETSIKDFGEYLVAKVDEITTVTFYKPRRVSARKRGNGKIEIVAKEGTTEFKDFMIVRPLGFTIIAEFQEIMSRASEIPEAQVAMEMIQKFPAIMMKLVKEASFPMVEQEFEEFDDFLKTKIIELLFQYFHDIGVVAAKK